MADRKKMEGHCSTGQSPQWAVVPMEEEAALNRQITSSFVALSSALQCRAVQMHKAALWHCLPFPCCVCQYQLCCVLTLLWDYVKEHCLLNRVTPCRTGL